MIDFSKFIKNRIGNIEASDAFAFATATGLGPWIVPMAPAIIFGYALYKSAPEDMGEFRIVTAIAVGIGLVVAGAVSSHNAVASRSSKAWTLVGAYIILEIVGLWLMTVTFDVKVVGTVASFLTLVVYISRANSKELDNERSKENEAIADEKDAGKQRLNFDLEQARLDAQHRRESETAAADMAHAQKLAKIEAKVNVSQESRGTEKEEKESQKVTLDELKGEIIAALGAEKPNVAELASQLGIGRSTLYRHLGTLSETGEIVKNGNGYKPVD